MLNLLKRKKIKLKTILIVDDEPDIRSMISFRLEHNNYKTLTAENGKQALEIAQKTSPDLILLDTSMPIMDGLQTLEALRSDQNLRNIKVIMVTALAEANNITAASALGVSDYVTKPFDFAELLKKIESLFSDNN